MQCEFDYLLDTNKALKAFLQARNPKQQHTGTLESYLITPIQVPTHNITPVDSDRLGSNYRIFRRILGYNPKTSLT